MTTIIKQGDNKKRAKAFKAGIDAQAHTTMLATAKKEAMAVVSTTGEDPITTYRSELEKRGFVYFGQCGYSYILASYLRQRYSIWFDRLKAAGKLPRRALEACSLLDD
jgi:hypothetical protein